MFIDAANLENSAKDLGFKINYRKLKRLFVKKNNLVYIGFYAVAFENRRHKTFLKSLRAKGYKIISKPLKIIRARDQKIGDIRKANFDVEIAVDAMEMRDRYDTFVLFSGDSDFDYLINKLQGYEKYVLVISTRFHIARELATRADKYIDLRKLRRLIERGGP